MAKKGIEPLKVEELDLYFKVIWTIGNKHNIPLDDLMDDLTLSPTMRDALERKFAARRRQIEKRDRQLVMANKV